MDTRLNTLFYKGINEETGMKSVLIHLSRTSNEDILGLVRAARSFPSSQKVENSSSEEELDSHKETDSDEKMYFTSKIWMVETSGSLNDTVPCHLNTTQTFIKDSDNDHVLERIVAPLADSQTDIVSRTLVRAQRQRRHIQTGIAHPCTFCHLLLELNSSYIYEVRKSPCFKLKKKQEGTVKRTKDSKCKHYLANNS